MKHSQLTYYLLAILCMIATSCVTDGVMDECPDNGQSSPMLIEGGRMNLILTFPAASATRGVTGETDDGTEKERKINDVQIYTFVDGSFVEEVQYILISGRNGDATRHIEGKLSETYTSGKAMDFVVIANAESKGVTNISMNKGDSKNDLYNRLIYTYSGKDWSENIPMWGTGTIPQITEGTWNVGEVTLKRAIAKVNITVNDGAGLENFRITRVTLNNYNTTGYCAPIASNGPSVPASAVPSSVGLTFSPTGMEGNNIKDKFYIPEHKNIGVAENKKVSLVIEASVNNNTKTYTLAFAENGETYDVLRNYMYVFNIKSVNTDVDATLIYDVKQWENIAIDVPAFGS